MPGGPDLDSWTAGVQSRDLQRDAPIRLGACVFSVLAAASILAKLHYGVALHWLIPVGISAVVAIGVGYWAHRRGQAITARAAEEDRAERERRKQAQIEEMQRSRNA